MPEEEPPPGFGGCSEGEDSVVSEAARTFRAEVSWETTEAIPEGPAGCSEVEDSEFGVVASAL